MSNKVKSWPRLYKLNTRGKEVQWDTWVESNGNGCLIFVQHGQVDGKLQQTSLRITEGKNIGKKNETSAQEQAVSEAESKWKKQQDRKGYYAEGASVTNLRPMLAKSHDKDGHHILFPCFGQPKLDGIRCIARKEGLFSRQSKHFTSLGHIQEALASIFKENPDIILDGELYVHGSEFQSIVSSIKRDSPSPNTHKIQYHLYDLISDDNYSDRLEKLQKIVSDSPNKSIKLVKTFKIKSRKEIDEKHALYTSKGFEGIMLRNTSGPYKIDGRSKDLQKYKKFMDEEFEIIGAYENRGKQSGQCTFVCVTKTGTEFGVKPKGTDAQRKQYWKDWQAGKLEGKMMTVEFFSWTDSENPVPRFPVGKSVRDYE